ncbi:MAG: peptide deformylase [Burkholderiales bacterium RIFCSPHIGHO2_12_FULL_69_20]|nr:MAG: peptide deformylase [Burkholderiales bacterium RIFCSPHIGHO2_12_FULL_69_20]
MPQLNILRYPDPRLHTVAKPVAEVDERLRRLADDMLETMYAADGVGLAATQVDVHVRLLVMDTSAERDQPQVLINPEITARSAEMIRGDEGCLSVPTIYDEVERHARVSVRALGRDGQPFEFEAEGLAAVCVQHEMDHLLGKVFVEYLSLLKRERIKIKMIKKTRDELGKR